MALKPPNSVGHFLKNNLKDKVDINYKPGIYKIDCQKCDRAYIGQTKRRLKDRMYDHDYELKGRLEKSVFLEHFIENGHHPDLQKPKYLAPFSNYLMANINESYQIQTSPNLLNRNIRPVDFSDYLK